MTYHELIAATAATAGLTRDQSRRAVDAAVTAIVAACAAGDRVTLHGFGIWETVERKARTARNPRTGEAVAVPARRQPRFRPGRRFRDAVDG